MLCSLGERTEICTVRGAVRSDEMIRAPGKNTVPVNSVNAHNEGLNIGVGGTAELAAGLSTEWGAVT